MRTIPLAILSLLLPVLLVARDTASDRRGWEVTSFTSIQDGVQSAQKTRFSNIRFTRGFFKIETAAPNMVLRPDNDIIRTQVEMVINPAVPHPGTIKAGCEAAWTVASAGKRVKGGLSRSEVTDVDGGGKLMSIAAQFEPAGGCLAAVVTADGKITRLTLTAETDASYQLAVMNLGTFFMSLEIARDQPPAAGAGAGAGGPTTGPDPSDAFDWDGPDRFEYGIYDHDCRDTEEEYSELVRTNDGLVGSVRARTVTYANALNAARLVLQNPQAKSQYDHAVKFGSKEYPKLYVASAVARLMDGDPFGALSHVLAGVGEAPSDPTLLYNLAAILANVNMPNESLAVLKQLESTGKKPGMAAGIDPGVAMTYLAGYNEMVRGNLQVAATKLKTVIAADSFLNEASHCLALITAKQGGNGKRIFQDGLFRFKPKKTVFCVTGQTDIRRPPIDEMFDCSKGVPGNLSDIRHPAGMDSFRGFMEVRGRLMEEATNRIQVGQAAMTANPMPLPANPTPYDAWADKMSQLIESLDESEPLFLKLKKDIEKSREDLDNASKIHYGRLMKRINEIALNSTQHKCPELRDAASQALNAMRPYIVHWDVMHRRHAKTTYRVMTGMLSYFGPGKWRDSNQAYFRTYIAGLDAGFLAELGLLYSPIAAASEAIEETCIGSDAGQGSAQASQDGPPCPDGLKGAGFKYALGLSDNGPKVGVKADCKAITFDIDFPLIKVKSPNGLLEYGLGGFAQVEMEYGGNWSVFMGGKGSLHVGGVGGQEKAGVYVKGSVADGATEMGGRVSFEGQAKVSDYTISQKGDSMDFAVIPAPKAPVLGPGLKGFRNQEPSNDAIFYRLRALQPRSCCSLN